MPERAMEGAETPLSGSKPAGAMRRWASKSAWSRATHSPHTTTTPTSTVMEVSGKQRKAQQPKRSNHRPGGCL